MKSTFYCSVRKMNISAVRYSHEINILFFLSEKSIFEVACWCEINILPYFEVKTKLLPSKLEVRQTALFCCATETCFELFSGNPELKKQNTVEPVYNGPALSGHPLLRGQFSGHRFFTYANAVFVTSIRWSPLLSSCGHPIAVLCLSFFVIFTCIKPPPLNRN